MKPVFEVDPKVDRGRWRITLPNKLDNLYIDASSLDSHGVTFRLHHSTPDSVKLVAYVSAEQLEFIIDALRAIHDELDHLPHSSHIEEDLPQL